MDNVKTLQLTDEHKSLKKFISSKINSSNKKILSLEKKVDVVMGVVTNDIGILVEHIKKLNKKINDLRETNNELIVKLDKKNLLEEKVEQNLSNSNDGVTNLKNIKSGNILQDIKINNFDLNIKFVQKCLDLNSLVGDTKIFKKMYLDGVNKELYPVRYINKKNYQYWYDNKWNNDVEGEYIKKVIVKNIQQCYLKANQYDNYGQSKMEQFLKNQTHLNKLSDDKYQCKWLTSIKQLIAI